MKHKPYSKLTIKDVRNILRNERRNPIYYHIELFKGYWYIAHLPTGDCWVLSIRDSYKWPLSLRGSYKEEFFLEKLNRLKYKNGKYILVSNSP